MSGVSGVVVDWSACRRELAALEDAYWHVLVRPGGGGRWDVAGGTDSLWRAVVAAQEFANESVPPETSDATEVGVCPWGVVLRFDPPGTVEEAVNWLGYFTEHLTRAGVSASVEPSPWPDGPPWAGYYVRRTGVSALIGYTLDEPLPGPRQRRMAWGLSPERTEEICEGAQQWCAGLPDAAAYLGLPWFATVEYDGPNAGRILADATPVLCSGNLTRFRETPFGLRHVELEAWGKVGFQVDEEGGWRQQVDVARRVLVEQAAEIDLGVVRRLRAGSASWFSCNVPRVPYLRSLERFLHGRHLWDRWVLDAHGMQVLTDAHLDRAHDLSGWLVEPVAPGRHLVQAADLRGWYEADQPDPEVLAAARCDFGNMILTDEVADANPRP